MNLWWDETEQFLASIRTICPQVALTVETHELGLDMARRHGLSIYDAMIVAAARLAECAVLYSEDMQHARVIDGSLTIVDPFVSPPAEPSA